MCSPLPHDLVKHDHFPRPRESQIRVQKHSQLFIRSYTEALAAVAAIMASIVRSMGGYKPPFPIPKTQSASHLHTQRNAFRRRDARQQSRIVRPLKSIAETQPQLQPALLRLSAMISQ
jgi:hypothetical protein